MGWGEEASPRVNPPTIEELFEKQLSLQIERMLLDPRDLDHAEAADFIRWNMLACEDELHEALQEVDWKPWATGTGALWRDVDSYRKELIDALHFFLNLYMTSFLPGSSPRQMAQDLLDRYRRKNEVNRRRQEQGYDGVTGKCSACRREWDNKANFIVTCFIPPAAVCVCGHNCSEEEVAWLMQHQ